MNNMNNMKENITDSLAFSLQKDDSTLRVSHCVSRAFKSVTGSSIDLGQGCSRSGRMV